jgi:hypothetical protein
MFKNLFIAGPLLLATAGCVVYEHPHRHHPVDDEVVVYDVEGPPPPPRQEVIVDRPYVGAVWFGGRWEIDREHHRWLWRHGYWR